MRKVIFKNIVLFSVSVLTLNFSIFKALDINDVKQTNISLVNKQIAISNSFNQVKQDNQKVTFSYNIIDPNKVLGTESYNKQITDYLINFNVNNNEYLFNDKKDNLSVNSDTIKNLSDSVNRKDNDNKTTNKDNNNGAKHDSDQSHPRLGNFPKQPKNNSNIFLLAASVVSLIGIVISIILLVKFLKKDK
ncbi:hypothetical protein [Mycoplasma putrefaciens]|uniref:Uncharacterized protein n=1 Tax=Mycoplasma putrefaciens Mput9231 TaxID=1292033 RepID=M9WHU2_9MOLU|nr:hypothetical protein [Mycoplasma putrefaciens]AGJ91035.1 Hypothetical protein, predicted transmembrane protein [Mycoplasma putrefaciens Mput9231]